MHRAITALVAFVLFACASQGVFAQSAPPTTAPAGTIDGRVINRTTNAAVAASITIDGPVHKTFRTQSDGAFSIDVPPGIYTLTANAGGLQASGVNDLTVTAGSTVTVSVEMAEATTSTLRTIGRVNVTRVNALNTNSNSVSYLSSAQITQRQIPQLNDIANELPGITRSFTSGATANTFLVARGAFQETRVNIDGHPLSSGTFGNWNTNYANAQIFDSVEVLKGAGLNGPTAGESAVGTINLRTRDFSPKNYVDANVGLDAWGGSAYSFFGNANFLKDDKLSVLVGTVFNGFRGPYFGYFGNRVGSSTFALPGTYRIPNITGLLQWQGDFSNSNNLRAQLAKTRFRFSPATSVSFEYLGLQGQYYPQGGSYGSYQGLTTISPCFTAGKPVSDPAACGLLSVYNAPYAKNQIGQTVPTYFWFPDSYIQNNEPQFSAELRTTYKNDTILFRPYTAVINRFISGDVENRYPGNGGAWYQVTDPANCQANFASPTGKASPANPSGSAKGPCFGSNMTPQNPAYIGAADPHSVVYKTTNAAPTCSPSSPCWTTVTAQQNNGGIGFGTPFSQPEVDRLFGYTFQYLHPFASNLVGFSYDYNQDATQSFTNDTTPVAPGCTAVIGTNVSNAPTVGATPKPNPFFQPTCVTPAGAPFIALPRTSISIPLTVINKNDFALTGLFQVRPDLQFAFGNYVTLYKAHGQVQNAATLAAATALGNPLGAPVDPSLFTSAFGHYDPHFGLSYRANPELNLRATAGSSITTPYASLISGLGAVDLPNGANGQTYTVNVPNPGLTYETTVAFDVGGDFRLPDTGIVSFDLFKNSIYNAFVRNYTTVAPVPGINAAGGFFNSFTINGPLLRSYGAELTISRTVPRGFGYYASTTLQRAYLERLPASLYVVPSPLINGAQLQGNSLSQSAIPYAKGYYEGRLYGVRNSLLTLGVQWEGNNNSTFGPGYTTWNASGRMEVSPGFLVAITGENIFGFSTGTSLGRSLLNQGSQTLTNVQAPNGAIVYGPSTNKSLQQVPFRTYRFGLSKRL